MGLLVSTCRYPDLGLSVRGIEDGEIGALCGAISDSSVKRDYCVIFERSNGAYTPDWSCDAYCNLWRVFRPDAYNV